MIKPRFMRTIVIYCVKTDSAHFYPFFFLSLMARPVHAVLPRTPNLKSLQYSVQQYHQFSSKRLSLLDVVIRINIFKSSQIVFDRAFRNVPILLVCCLLCLLKHCVQSKRSIDRSVEAHTTENILDAKNCYYNNTMILL